MTAQMMIMPEGTVYIIRHTHAGTMWSLHRGGTKVVAFKTRKDASAIARRLWVHRLTAHRWPDTEAPEIRLSDRADVVLMSQSPLEVEETDLRDLLLELSNSDAAVSLVDELLDSGDGLNIIGSHVAVSADATQKISWLNALWKKRSQQK